MDVNCMAFTSENLTKFITSQNSPAMWVNSPKIGNWRLLKVALTVTESDR